MKNSVINFNVKKALCKGEKAKCTYMNGGLDALKRVKREKTSRGSRGKEPSCMSTKS